MKPLVLTFDIGTQSLRAELINDTGDILLKEQIKYENPYFSLNPGWAEQHGEYYWENICKASKDLKEKAGELWDDIEAVSFATIRDTEICVDKDGKPVRPVFLWLDKRNAEVEKPFDAVHHLSFKLVGMDKLSKLMFNLAHCNWVMNKEPENWAKTDKFLQLSGYFTLCFTGKAVDCTANIIGHMPYDSKNSKWLEPNAFIYPLFPVPREKLCDLVEPGEVLGYITEKAAKETGIKEGLPLIATGSDKGCETLGLSCTTSDKAALSFGTTATIQYTTEKYVEPQRFIPPFVAAYKGRHNPEFEVYRGYWLISWFKREFAAKEVRDALEQGVTAEELLNARLKEIPPGCEGLVFQPYFTPGVSTPNARGSVIGFTDVHTRIHIYRAIIEGINFALYEGMKDLEKRIGVKTKGIYIAGGGSRSAEICQITADMFGIPAYRSQTNEATGIGSAAIAFTGIGRFKDIDEAVENMVHIKDTFLPNEETHKIYERIYDEIYSKVFDRLKPLYNISRDIEDARIEALEEKDD